MLFCVSLVPNVETVYLWSKKESVGRCRCQSSTRHRQTPKLEIEQPTPTLKLIRPPHLYGGG